MNSRVGKWLVDQLSRGVDMNEKDSCEPRLRGWILADFYDSPEHSLVDLLVECNFRGRRTGEEGW